MMKKAHHIYIYNIWHLLVILVIIAVTVVLFFLFKNKNDSNKKKLLDIYAAIIIGLYFTDFLTHPIIEQENLLLVDKLPFHLCTSACLLIAFVRLFPKWCVKWRHVPPVLGLVGGLFYILCPTGVDGDSLFCYRTLQTLIYHGMLITYGILSIALNDIEVTFKNFYHYLIVVSIQIVISIIANYVYTVPGGHSYDWYFSLSDPIGLGIPTLAEPFVILFAISLLVAIIYGIVYLVRAIKHKSAK